MTLSDKIVIGLIIFYFVALYVIAFICNRHYREKDDILFLSRRQWKAILVMWIPCLFAFFRR